MIASDLEAAVDSLGELIEAARVIVPFTGAGISTECGIPDFRSPGGLWTKNQPIPFDAFVASRDMRDESWRRRFAMEESFAERKTRPRPSRARQSLPRRQGPGLDHPEYRQPASGFRHCAERDIVELHGNTTYAICLDCAERYELVLGAGKIRGLAASARPIAAAAVHQDRDHLVRPGHAGRGDAARRGN